MANGTGIGDNHINLYTALIDQLQKYNTIIWQGPTALIAANFFALDKFCSNPLLLFVLFIFNSVLIYSFHRQVINQRVIINTTKKAEDELRKTFGIFIPKFPEPKVKAGSLLIWTLYMLNLMLLVYSAIIVL